MLTEITMFRRPSFVSKWMRPSMPRSPECFVLANPPAGVTLIDLPSSSPAHARPFAEKAAAWAALGGPLS